MKLLNICLSALAVAALSACSGHNGWKVSGTIANAPENAKVSVDAFSSLGWYSLDSVKVAKDGTFQYTAQVAAAYPDVYRVTLDGKSIYFPVDSVDHVVITADANDLLSGYTLSGTPSAETFVAIDGIINEAIANHGADGALSDTDLKRQLGSYILGDSVGIVSYYLINKRIGNKTLFSLDNSMDVKLLGAVANKFAVSRPGDPRTKYLEELYMQGRKRLGQTSQTIIEADASGLLEIELYDLNGVKRSLADTADKSKVTLLSFTIYSSDPSAAYTIVLNDVYEKYKDRGLSIYQVGLDPDEATWGQSAVAMPWTAVYSNPANSEQLIYQYNVGIIPLTYLINSNGDIVERIEDPSQLSSIISKYI